MNICLFSDSYLPEINGVATSVNSLYKLLKSYLHNFFALTKHKSHTLVRQNSQLLTD